MNEVFWFHNNDVQDMSRYITGRATQRKLRLLACTLVRHFYWDQLPFQAKQLVRAAENYADDPNGFGILGELVAEFQPSHLYVGNVEYYEDEYDEDEDDDGGNPGQNQTPGQLALNVARLCATPDARMAFRGVLFAYGATHDSKEVCQLIRESFGNPFCPSVLERGWRSANDHAVIRLAHTIYTDQAYQLLPVLADALEEAGCQDEAIFDHLRDPTCEHIRGCWVLDLILGDSPILATPIEDFFEMDSHPAPELIVPRGTWVFRLQSHCSPKNHPFEDDYPHNALDILTKEFPEVALAEHVDQRELSHHPYITHAQHYWYIAERPGLPFPTIHHATRAEGNANGWALLYDHRSMAAQDLANIYPPLSYLEETRSLPREELHWLVHQADEGDTLALRSIAGVLEVSGIEPDLAARIRDFAGGHTWKKRSVEQLRKDVERERVAIQYQTVQCPQCNVKGMEVVRSDEVGEMNDRLQVRCVNCEWTEWVES